jgi:hypothetical protein
MWPTVSTRISRFRRESAWRSSCLGGSLQVSRVEGSKDIAADAGNIEILVGDRERYRQVTASVQSGELAAPAFDEGAKEIRSFHWTGRGESDLRVRVDRGRITLKK